MNSHSAGWDPGFTPQDVAALANITKGPVLVAGDPELADEVSDPDTTILHEPGRRPGRCQVLLGVPATACRHGAGSPGAQLRERRRAHHYNPHEPDTPRVRGRTAIARAGALWSDVVDLAAELGLAPLVPSYPGTGIVGRPHGWNAGHVRSIEVVAATGHLVHVTPVSDPRLFELLCRSDPSDVGLGVITAMEFILFR